MEGKEKFLIRFLKKLERAEIRILESDDVLEDETKAEQLQKLMNQKESHYLEC